MRWSRYNTLFRSDGLGRFCYNALSNTLIELDEKHYGLLEELQRRKEFPDSRNNGFLGFLREKRVLVEENEEANLLLVRHFHRQAACFQTSTLGLTICPTLSCNFRCAYCFEASQQDGRFMNSETQERLVEWIKENLQIKTLQVAWYGGEPLLGFDTMCSLTESFLALGLVCENFTLVTNGYLLDQEKIDRLNDLKINEIQITLDGPQDVHDQRRVLVGGGPTFRRIMKNLATLMDSDYSGHCEIRINVDKRNKAGFLGLRDELLARFRGKKLLVYPGRVDAFGGRAYDCSSCLDGGEWASFNSDLVRHHGMYAVIGIYPVDKLGGTCVASKRNGFVVGPEGELYKCWNDVGRPDLVVGNIHAKNTITNPFLLAQYATGVDPYCDPDCLACTVLPICGGGCPYRRLMAKYRGRAEIEYCSPYKWRLQEDLEAYIDTVRTREMCDAVLQTRQSAADEPGYRVISPGAGKNPQQASAGDV